MIRKILAWASFFATIGCIVAMFYLNPTREPRNADVPWIAGFFVSLTLTICLFDWKSPKSVSE